MEQELVDAQYKLNTLKELNEKQLYTKDDDDGSFNSPKALMAHKKLQKKLHRLAKDQITFLNKIKKIDAFTGLNLATEVDKKLESSRSQQYFNPAKFEIYHQLKSQESKNVIRHREKSKKQLDKIRSKYPGFFLEDNTPKNKLKEPIPNMTHPENHPVFNKNPTIQEPMKKAKKVFQKKSTLLEVADQAKIEYKFYIKRDGPCHDMHGIQDGHLIDNQANQPNFDFSQDICGYCNEPITTEQKYALLKMLIKKNSKLNVKNSKIALKTENTSINHMIKQWAHQGVFKKEIVFEDEIIKKKKTDYSKGLNKEVFDDLKKVVNECNFNVPRLSHVNQNIRGHSVESIVGEVKASTNIGNVSIKAVNQLQKQSSYPRFSGSLSQLRQSTDFNLKQVSVSQKAFNARGSFVQNHNNTRSSINQSEYVGSYKNYQQITHQIKLRKEQPRRITDGNQDAPLIKSFVQASNIDIDSISQGSKPFLSGAAQIAASKQNSSQKDLCKWDASKSLNSQVDTQRTLQHNTKMTNLSSFEKNITFQGNVTLSQEIANDSSPQCQSIQKIFITDNQSGQTQFELNKPLESEDLIVTKNFGTKSILDKLGKGSCHQPLGGRNDSLQQVQSLQIMGLGNQSISKSKINLSKINIPTRPTCKKQSGRFVEKTGKNAIKTSNSIHNLEAKQDPMFLNGNQSQTAQKEIKLGKRQIGLASRRNLLSKIVQSNQNKSVVGLELTTNPLLSQIQKNLILQSNRGAKGPKITSRNRSVIEASPRLVEIQNQLSDLVSSQNTRAVEFIITKDQNRAQATIDSIKYANSGEMTPLEPIENKDFQAIQIKVMHFNAEEGNEVGSALFDKEGKSQMIVFTQSDFKLPQIESVQKLKQVQDAKPSPQKEKAKQSALHNAKSSQFAQILQDTPTYSAISNLKPNSTQGEYQIGMLTQNIQHYPKEEILLRDQLGNQQINVRQSFEQADDYPAPDSSRLDHSRYTTGEDRNVKPSLSIDVNYGNKSQSLKSSQDSQRSSAEVMSRSPRLSSIQQLSHKQMHQQQARKGIQNVTLQGKSIHLASQKKLLKEKKRQQKINVKLFSRKKESSVEGWVENNETNSSNSLQQITPPIIKVQQQYSPLNRIQQKSQIQIQLKTKKLSVVTVNTNCVKSSKAKKITENNSFSNFGNFKNQDLESV